MEEIKKLTPAEVLEHENFAVMYSLIDGKYEWMQSTHCSHDAAMLERDSLNSTRDHNCYVVVEIDHGSECADTDTNLATVNLLGEVVEDGEKDAMLGALRYAYQMLDEGELEPSDILQCLRGYCEASGLVEFA
jgi:hypothetical protein